MKEVNEIGSAKEYSLDVPTEADNRRRRILVSAYAFSPVLGSEPGVGWNICSRLAAYHDVTVLTRSWNEKLWPEDEQHKEEAERFMRDNGPIQGLTIHFVSSPPLSRLLQTHPHVSLRSPFYFQGYAAWQRAAYREAVRLHRERPFDVTHQLTTTSFREPGYLWKLDVPFIWGPTGGGGNIPWSYFADFGSHDRLYYALKNIANQLHVWTKWRSRMAARRAELVLVNSAELYATDGPMGKHSPHNARGGDAELGGSATMLMTACALFGCAGWVCTSVGRLVPFLARLGGAEAARARRKGAPYDYGHWPRDA